MDHPSGDGTNSWVVSKCTREQGVKMAFSGLGADELFAGYGRYKSLRKPYKGAFRKLKFLEVGWPGSEKWYANTNLWRFHKFRSSFENSLS